MTDARDRLVMGFEGARIQMSEQARRWPAGSSTPRPGDEGAVRM